MFTIKTEPFGRFTQIKLINSITGEYFGVIPDYGATFNALVLRKDERLCDIIDGSNTFDELMNEGTSISKGMILFPFPNRIEDGKYSFEGKEYQLDINEKSNNNAIHGLVAHSKFKVKKFEADDTFASLDLVYDELGTNEGYPFKCRLTIQFELNNNSELICKTTVENLDDKNIPVGVGWHPYFKALDTINSLELKVPSDKILEIDSRMLTTGKTLTNTTFLNGKEIGKTEMDTCFVLEPKNGVVTTELYDRVNNATVEIWQETGSNKYNFVQFYIPESRKSIAIESMTCPANAFNTRHCLITLAPKQKVSFNFGVKLR